MAYYSKEIISDLDHLFRLNLINSASGFKSANLIGTKSKSGIENVAIFSSVTHIGTNPPLLGFFCRPTIVPRHTYNNIKETGMYTINHIAKSMIKDAHHTSAKYNDTISEFDKTNLTPEYKRGCVVPYVKESPIKLQMQFIEDYFIKANNTILVIGEIQKLYIKDGLLEKDGLINLSKAKVATINGLDTYSVPKSKKRLSYQKPKM